MKVTTHGEEEDSDHHHHHHGGMADIRGIVSGLPLPTMVKLDILSVYEEIAQAESQVHGVPMEHIHFHEVGTMDAIADITAVCLLLHRLAPDKVVASPVHVGSGQVRCAHGILPVPAPATAYLLRGIPIYGGEITGELCTPTGAALLKYFATEFGPMPVMRVQAMGYGMGKKDFPRANCVRAMLGETEDAGDRIVELQCNVDDMTGEAIGFALEQLRFLGLERYADMPAGKLPYGARKSLEIARCLCMKPRLMLMDEPASGLNTQEAYELGGMINRLDRESMIIIVIEHNMALVRQIAGRVIHIDGGRLMYELERKDWLSRMGEGRRA